MRKKKKRITMKGIKVILVLLIIGLIGIEGCKQPEPTPPPEPTQLLEAAGTMEDLARMNEKEDNNWMYIEGEYLQEDMIQRTMSRLPQCASRTKDSIQKKITIIFGSETSPCVTSGGTALQGIIETQYSGTPKQPGFQITITEGGFAGLSGFKIDDMFLNGNGTAKYEGLDSMGAPKWTITKNVTATYDTGEKFTFNGTITIKKVDGYTTKNPDDDIFEITGQGSGVNRDGNNYTVTIKKPLFKPAQCEHVVSGIMELTLGNLKVTIDFDPDGKGMCDNKARINVNNGQLVRDITL